MSSDPLIDVEIAEHVFAILEKLGYDTTDQHFMETGYRSSKVLNLFAKKDDHTEAVALLDAVFDDEHDALVQVGPITVTSMCAHHMLPVTGHAWVGYIPNGKVCGLSKLARITHYFARQFTVQERVTQDVADLLEECLTPLGAMVVIEAEHGCMKLRGVEEPSTVTVTSAIRGVFKDEPSARAEFISLMRRP